jgi:hypothetical protein
VILRGDEHSLIAQVLHGVVPPAVAVGHLRRAAPECKSQQLVAQTDTECRDAGRLRIVSRA